MSFDAKRFPLSIHRLPQDVPDDVLEHFATRSAGRIDDVKEEPVIGWVGGRNVLEFDIDEGNSMTAGRPYLHLRRAERKIPRTLLQAECRLRELSYLRENGGDVVPGRIRREIRQAVEKDRIMSMAPQIKAVPIIIERREKLLFAGSASLKDLDLLVEQMQETIGIVPSQVEPADLAFHAGIKNIEALPPVSFAGKGEEKISVPARDFLTWLWYYSEERGGKFSLGNYGKFEVIVDGPLTMAATEEDVGGAAETVIRKGAPLRSAEAKAALTFGKKLRKARLLAVRGEDVWSMNFDADKFVFGAFTPPESEEMDAASVMEDKILNMIIFTRLIELMFKTFCQVLTGKDWADEQKKIRDWSSSREAR